MRPLFLDNEERRARGQRLPEIQIAPMRQMVATLFQRLCQEHVDLAVEVHTALSGEQAVRQAACGATVRRPRLL